MGYSVVWSGQYEYMVRAKATMKLVIPTTLAIIFLLLYFNFKRVGETLIVMISLPFAVVGGLWFIWALGYNWSVAMAIGFVALARIAADYVVQWHRSERDEAHRRSDDWRNGEQHAAHAARHTRYLFVVQGTRGYAKIVAQFRECPTAEELKMSNSSEGPASHAHRLSVAAVGKAMSIFLVITVLLCVLLASVTGRPEFHDVWFKMLPGVTPLTWASALLGVVETTVYGWYIALVFVPLYNWASHRSNA